MEIRCVIHGSFRKHLGEIREAARAFSAAGVQVLAPSFGLTVAEDDGFVLFEGEQGADRRLIELRYLHHIKALGEGGFSYFVNPGGYLGVSASYELGVAQLLGVRCFFAAALSDHPAYIEPEAVCSPGALAAHIAAAGVLPRRGQAASERELRAMFEDLVVPSSVVAAGAVIEHAHGPGEPDVLLVRTHKWGGRFSMVGGKVRRGERLLDALGREVAEETGLSVRVQRHIETFDQLRDSGYYLPGVQHVFVDYVVRAQSRRVRLNGEAQEALWVPASVALAELDIEPNARHTLELYVRGRA